MSQHLRLPFQLGADGEFATVAEDSVEEVTQNVFVVLSTRVAERLATPDLGIADQAFVGLDVDAARDLVLQWEPRAELQIVADELDRRGAQTLAVAVTRRQDGLA